MRSQLRAWAVAPFAHCPIEETCHLVHEGQRSVGVRLSSRWSARALRSRAFVDEHRSVRAEGECGCRATRARGRVRAPRFASVFCNDRARRMRPRPSSAVASRRPGIAAARRRPSSAASRRRPSSAAARRRLGKTRHSCRRHAHFAQKRKLYLFVDATWKTKSWDIESLLRSKYGWGD